MEVEYDDDDDDDIRIWEGCCVVVGRCKKDGLLVLESLK